MFLSRLGRTANIIRGSHGFSNSRISSVAMSENLISIRNGTIRHNSENAHLQEKPLVRTGLPPPLCGEDGYYYHYPGLITSIPTIGNVSGYERVFVVQKNNTRCFTKDYFVDVPYGLYPGETFRVLILADEFLITVPDIKRSGERIVVTLVSQ